MFSEKPKPTSDHLREVREMLGELEQLFEAGRETAYASEIRGVLAGGGEALEKWLTSGNFWGGMGSMIDCAFCAPSGLGYDIDKRNKRDFMRLIVKLGRYQLTSGIFTAGIKPHIRGWTEVFDGWLNSDVV